MKIKKYISFGLVIAIICCYEVSYAQKELSSQQWEEIHKKDLKNAPYIFEGIVLKQVPYKNKNGDSLTCNVLSIVTVFNYDFGRGTVKVITKGWHQDSTFIPSGTEGYFKRGEHCIFFCKLASSNMIIDSLPETTDKCILTPINDASAIVYTKKGIEWDCTIYRADSLTYFLGRNRVYDAGDIPPEF